MEIIIYLFFRLIIKETKKMIIMRSWLINQLSCMVVNNALVVNNAWLWIMLCTLLAKDPAEKTFVCGFQMAEVNFVANKPDHAQLLLIQELWTGLTAEPCRHNNLPLYTLPTPQAVPYCCGWALRCSQGLHLLLLPQASPRYQSQKSYCHLPRAPAGIE